MLYLNNDGRIIGGTYMRDSSIIDMLWVPLNPKQGGAKGNERGNPYIKVDTILAIWRESVDEETRNKWYTVDPAKLDRITESSALAATDEPVEIDDEATVETKLNGANTTAPVAVETDPRPAPVPPASPDDADADAADEDATEIDATEDDASTVDATNVDATNDDATNDDATNDDAANEDAANEDAANEDAASATSTEEAEENDEVAPVVVQVDADSTKMPVSVGSTTSDDKPLGN
jgi:hypothetical protein